MLLTPAEFYQLHIVKTSLVRCVRLSTFARFYIRYYVWCKWPVFYILSVSNLLTIQCLMLGATCFSVSKYWCCAYGRHMFFIFAIMDELSRNYFHFTVIDLMHNHQSVSDYRLLTIRIELWLVLICILLVLIVVSV